MGKKGSGIFALAVASLALGACGGTPDPIIGASTLTPRADLGQQGYTFRAPQTYSLRPSDIISINVFREPDFSLESVLVGVDGVVSMPMLGAVKVGGLTTSEAETLLANKLKVVGLKEPRVAVNISEYSSHLVTVEGAVTTPGVYPFKPGARLSSAIALARGVRREAKQEQLVVFRTREDGIYVALFDYGAISQGTMLDPVLEPDDRVVMGTDGLSVFYQDALQTIPALGIFATVAVQADNN
ncbi:MAG: polysaccharide biosynthesis/export family protein [Pseudomonadota bacterium]